MKSQLEALVGQMHSSGILYSEAVREFKKCYITDVLERQMLEHERQVRTARAEKLEQAGVAEDARAELRSGRPLPVDADVLQVREHEVRLEPCEELVQQPVLCRQELIGDVVVRVAHELQVR